MYLNHIFTTTIQNGNLVIRLRYMKESPPLFLNPVQAGFPSPAEDSIERKLDLNEHLIEHPAATFFVRVEGDSMLGCGIHKGDILIVDRSLDATNGKIIIAVLNGEFTVKRLKIEGKILWLVPENPKFPVLKIEPEWDFQVWGVVTYVIHDVRSC